MMTPIQIEHIQILETRERMILARLAVKDQAIWKLEDEIGPLRDELQKIMEEKYKLLSGQPA